MCVCVGESDTIKSTSIKSSLVTVQCTQLTVWKLCCAFFSSRLFCSQGSLLANLTFFFVRALHFNSHFSLSSALCLDFIQTVLQKEMGESCWKAK